LPAFVGFVFVNNLANSCVFHIGDVYRIAPRSASKTYSGAGSFNTADKLSVYNYESATNTFDKDIQDQGMNLNV